MFMKEWLERRAELTAQCEQLIQAPLQPKDTCNEFHAGTSLLLLGDLKPTAGGSFL